MRAGKGRSSQILAMILSLILASGSLMMPVFGEQSSKNTEEPITIEMDKGAEDEVTEAEAETVSPEDFGKAGETEKESVEESAENENKTNEETESADLSEVEGLNQSSEDTVEQTDDKTLEDDSSDQSVVEADADTAVEVDNEEPNDEDDTQYQSSEKVSEAPTQEVVSTGAQNAAASDLDPVSIEYAEVTGITDKTYDGSEQTQTLLVKYGDETLIENRDYEVYYYNNIEVGTAYVDIYGIGRYTGMIEETFSIKYIGWYEEYGTWYYADENGNYVTGWKLINGKWYYFYSWGEMAIGREYISGSYYRLSGSGAMITGWYKDSDGDWFYYLDSGKEVSGWQKIGGKWYYFDGYMYSDGEYYIDNSYYRFTASGAMLTGWYKDSDGDWYYFLPSGKRATGWQIIGGKWYYFGDNMYSGGEYYIDNTYYRFTGSGAMLTGWYQYSDGDWSYYLSSGKLAIGWQKIGGKWYYFSDGGWMVSDDLRIIGGKGYKFAKSGYLMYANTTGWVKTLDGNGNVDYWYYVNKGGALARGWQKISGKWYYFDTYDCEMYSERWGTTIDNKGYAFGSNGAMLGAAGGWIQDKWGEKYYANVGGSLVKGWKQISGKWYYFDANGGYYMYRSGTYKINQKSYTFKDNGVCTNR